MADKYFTDQFDDEEVLYVFRKHPIVMRRGLVLGMLGPLIGVLPATFKPELGFGWFFGGLAGGIILGLLLFMPQWIGWYFSTFVVTDQRFIQYTQKGFFHRQVSDIGLNHIQSMNYSIQGLEETLLGFGTITIQTYMGNVDIHSIHHPAKTHKKIQHILRDLGISQKPFSAEVKEQIENEED